MELGEEASGGESWNDLRGRLRVIMWAGIVIVAASFLYDLSFTIFGMANGQTFWESFLSQFSMYAWLEYWRSGIGLTITIIYLLIVVLGLVCIFRPQLVSRYFFLPPGNVGVGTDAITSNRSAVPATASAISLPASVAMVRPCPE